nr:sulfate ABC transporter protein [Cavernulicola chilensis]
MRLILENASKAYSNKPILNQISLSLAQGEIIGLLGPNGAGKTTLFSILAGIKQPDLGRVWINDLEITNYQICERARLGIGYLSQEPSTFSNLTIYENLKLILQEKGIVSPVITEISTMLLEEFQLTHVKNNYCKYISGGEKRRTEIARSLVNQPKFLLLDEPFAGVDPISIFEIQTVLKKLKKWNLGILITDHNVRETLQITDRAYIMRHGNFLAKGKTSEIYNNQSVKHFYLGGFTKTSF